MRAMLQSKTTQFFMGGGLILLLGVMANHVMAATTTMIKDGGFEQGKSRSAWRVESTNNFPLICDRSTTFSQPRSGNHWACLGHPLADAGFKEEVSIIRQRFIIPTEATETTLRFWLKIDRFDDTNSGQLGVFINDVSRWSVTSANPLYKDYQQVTVSLPLEKYPPGFYELAFKALIPKEKASFFSVDDVNLTVETPGDTVYLPLVRYTACQYPFKFNEDVDSSRLYHLDNTNVVDAWEVCAPKGKNIVVAVIDTGVDLDHPDLVDNLLPGISTAGTATVNDQDGHGTHVAGIVAAIANNATGSSGQMIGVAPQAKLLPINVLNGPNGGSNFAVATGINWAVDNGAKILNLSLGTTKPNQTIENALTRAYNRGLLIVAAAGNCGDANYQANNCTFINQASYPAAYNNLALAVASTDRNDQRASSSTRGSYVDVAAPGNAIYSTVLDGRYNFISGTSQATPVVSGLAALIWSQFPHLTNKQISGIIRASTDKLDMTDLPNDRVGYGLIDATAALKLAAKVATNRVKLPQPDVVSTPPVVVSADAPFVAGEIILKLNPSRSMTVARLLTAANLDQPEVRRLAVIEALGVEKIAVPIGQETDFVRALNQRPEVEYAELNYRVFAY